MVAAQRLDTVGSSYHRQLESQWKEVALLEPGVEKLGLR